MNKNKVKSWEELTNWEELTDSEKIEIMWKEIKILASREKESRWLIHRLQAKTH